MVTFPPFAVLKIISLFNAKLLSKIIPALGAKVVNLAMPSTVTVPLLVIFPLVAVAVKLPLILEFPSCTAVALTMLALPIVLKLISPVAAKLSKVIFAFAAVVEKLALPPTAIVPLSVITELAVAVKSPPISSVPKFNWS